MSRFLADHETVLDSQTGLMWMKNASFFEFPMSWDEALIAVKELNTSGICGYRNWKVPNRKELFSLMSHGTINPSLPKGHPFTNVFPSYYWSSSTCVRLPNQAWYIHLGGARVFKGMKSGSYMVWPVRTVEPDNKSELLETGQRLCFDEDGNTIDCHGTGQDGDIQAGRKLNENHFTKHEKTVYDHYTGLTWMRDANVHQDTMAWSTAFDLISELNSKIVYGYADWRVPNIIELESLTGMGQHSPALFVHHVFNNVQDFYWSSTTSVYDDSYAWVLYVVDGAVGVGYKPLSEFYLWPVRGKERRFA